MLCKNWLQFFAEGASDGDGGAASGVTPADAGQDAGVTSADAGQNFESRLEQLGVPKDKIRKGAYRNKAAAPAQVAEPEPETESGDADRKSWDEVKGSYKGEFDAEVQNIVQARIKKEQERVQQYADRESKIMPMLDYLATRYGLDPDNLDLDALMEKFRGDSSLSQEKALEMGTTEEVAHKLEMAEMEERRMEREKRARDQQLAAAFQRQQVNEHFDNLQAQAAELAKTVPGFDLMRELQDEAFAEMTRPGSKITVEQAYYALHPEFRQAEAQSVAKRATEAVAQSVRAGQSRPMENGTQAATIGKVSYKSMSKADREALKQRIYAAGARGEHLPYGG